ncbi:MAG: hypothetical protein ACOX71_04180 [Lachnospiraceae bacterium]
MKKKIISFALAAVLVLSAAGCGNKIDPNEKRYAFVTDSAGSSSDELVSAVWEGVNEYSNVRPCVATVYSAEEDTEKGFKAAIKTAVKDGAKIVVCAGDAMDVAVYNGQKDNKKVKFALVEGMPMPSEEYEAFLAEKPAEEEYTSNTNNPLGNISSQAVEPESIEEQESGESGNRDTIVVGEEGSDESNEGTDEEASAGNSGSVVKIKGSVTASTLGGASQPVATSEGEQVIASETVGAQNLLEQESSPEEPVSDNEKTAEPEEVAEGNENIAENTCVVRASRTDMGFLAGYIAVAEGHMKLGFMAGEENAENIAYCNGFIQGANSAAAERSFADGAISMNIKFFGDGKLSPYKMNEAVKWLENDGVEMIFSPEDGITRSVTKAMDLVSSGSVVTVNPNMKNENSRVTFSVGFDYKQAAKNVIESFENEEFQGGKEIFYGIGSRCVRVDDYTGLQAFTGTTLEMLVSNFNLGNISVSDADVRSGMAKVAVNAGQTQQDTGSQEDSGSEEPAESGSQEDEETGSESSEDTSSEEE